MRPIRRLRVLTSLMLIGASTGALPTGQAFAQRTGSRIGRDAGPKDGPTAIRMMAECYRDRSAKHVRLWLDTLPGEKAEEALLKGDVEQLSPCLDSNALVFDGKSIAFQPATLRAPVAAVEVRYMLRRMAKPASPVPDTKPWFESRLASHLKDADVDQRSLAIQSFGHCVALARWKESLDLLRSEDDSVEEAAAVQALAPALGPCLAQGASFKITRRRLRELMSEPVYHLLLGASAANGKKDA